MITATKSPTREWESIDKIERLQDTIRFLPGKLAQVDHMHRAYPGLSWSFISKNLGTLLGMDAAQLVESIGYPDPTGEQATRNVMRTKAA